VEETTLSDIRALVRSLADEQLKGVFTDTRLLPLINMKIRSVRSWALDLPHAYEYFATRETFSLTASQATYELGSGGSSELSSPAVQVLEVAILWATDRREIIEPVETREFHELSFFTWGEMIAKGMLVRHGSDGMEIEIAPTPTTASTVAVTYIPGITSLSSDSDTLVGPEGMADVVAVETAKFLPGMQGKPSQYLDQTEALARDAVKRALRNSAPRYGARVLDVAPEASTTRKPWRFLPPA